MPLSTRGLHLCLSLCWTLSSPFLMANTDSLCSFPLEAIPSGSRLTVPPSPPRPELLRASPDCPQPLWPLPSHCSSLRRKNYLAASSTRLSVSRDPRPGIGPSPPTLSTLSGMEYMCTTLESSLDSPQWILPRFCYPTLFLGSLDYPLELHQPPI